MKVADRGLDRMPMSTRTGHQASWNTTLQASLTATCAPCLTGFGFGAPEPHLQSPSRAMNFRPNHPTLNHDLLSPQSRHQAHLLSPDSPLVSSELLSSRASCSGVRCRGTSD